MHVVRLSSIDLLEAQGLLVPGQGSTLHIWGFFAEDGEESSVVISGLGEKKAEVAELGSTSPVSAYGQLPMPRPISALSYSRRNEISTLLRLSSCCS
jgi:hypothetical protein